MKKLKVIFMGTPEIAVPFLENLIDKVDVLLVVTKPDQKIGRKKILTASPIKQIALKHGIKVFQPSKVKNDFDLIKKLQPDLIITFAFGEILPVDVLNIPQFGAINVHASLLPKYRGSAPIQRAILNGDKETGVTLMYMNQYMDEGDIIASEKVSILENDNLQDLTSKLSIAAVELFNRCFDLIINNNIKRIKQNNDIATYAPPIKRSDELLDFNDSVINIYNKIRAFSPQPLSYFKIDDLEIKVIKASYKKKEKAKPGCITEIDKCHLGIDAKDGIIYLDKIKPFGKKEMDIVSFLNGINKEKLKGKKVC